MIKEDFVSYEIAKLLEEKGFNESCDNYYDQSSDEPQQLTLDEMYYSYDEFIKAPTHQMAMKWLRKVHKLYIGINIEVGDIQMLPSYDFEETVLGYNFVIYNEETLIWVFKDKTPRSYEEAVEAAIKYCLKNLI